jgi:RNA polymerase sigma-70 factor (ECF subfamily)
MTSHNLGTRSGENCRSNLISHINALRRYARALVGNSADADDLVQESLKRSLQYLDGTRQIHNLRAYLFTILHNTRMDSLARQRREGIKVPVEEDSIRSSGAPQVDRLVCSQVFDAIQQLSEEHREVLLLVGVEGLSYREASEILGIAIGTVMSRLSRARTELREKLAIEGAVIEADGAP